LDSSATFTYILIGFGEGGVQIRIEE